MGSLYEPSDELERQVLWGLLYVPDFLRYFADHGLSEQIFFSKRAKAYRWICNSILRHHSKWRVLTTEDQILNEVTNHAKKNELDVEEAEAGFRLDLKKIRASQVPTNVLKSKLEELVKLYKNNAILKTLGEVGRYYKCQFKWGKSELCKKCPAWKDCRLLSKSRYPFEDRLVSLLSSHLHTIKDRSGGETIARGEASQMIDARIAEYEERKNIRSEADVDFTFGIPTPWPTMTNALDGWKRGKIYTIMARRKVGKTTCLLMAAKRAIDAGCHVLFAYMEDTVEEMMDKFIVTASEISQKNFSRGTIDSHIDNRLKDMRDRYRQGWEEGRIGKLFHLHRPIGKLGLDDVIAEYERRSAEGFPPALVLFDYLQKARLPEPSLMKPERLSEFIVQSRAYADINNFTFLTAAQIATSGARKDEMRWTDEVIDSLDGAWKLEEDKNGNMKMVTVAARGFAPFAFDLENHKDQILLPERLDDEEEGDLEMADLDIIPPEEDFYSE